MSPVSPEVDSWFEMRDGVGGITAQQPTLTVLVKLTTCRVAIALYVNSIPKEKRIVVHLQATSFLLSFSTFFN